MKNKIVVNVLVPSISENFNMFIPVNKTVGEIIKLLNMSINELTEEEFPLKDDLSLININDGTIYNTGFSVFNIY